MRAAPRRIPLWLGALVAVVLLYLIFPILVIVPLSLSSALYLSFPPPSLSLQWYRNFFSRADWLDAAWLSIWVGSLVMVLATALGTPAAWFQGVRATRSAKDGSAVDGAAAQRWCLVPGDQERQLSPAARQRRK